MQDCRNISLPDYVCKKNKLWYKWKIVWVKPAKPSCNVFLKLDEQWVITNDIEYDISKYDCWWDITIKKAKVKRIDCTYTFTNPDNVNLYSDTDIVKEVVDTEERDDFSKFINNTYVWDNIHSICNDYFWYHHRVYSEKLIANPEAAKTYADLQDYIGEAIKNPNLKTFVGRGVVTETDSTNSSQVIIWWKWTLTENSWSDSIHKEDPQSPFSWFLDKQASDPKYDSSQYKDYWLWFYIYSVFRDKVWTWNQVAKSLIWGTQYELAATLEKESEKALHPETLIIWNYKRPKNDISYPVSLIWWWGRNVIVTGQLRWEKAQSVANPDGISNLGIPYPVEKIK